MSEARYANEEHDVERKSEKKEEVTQTHTEREEEGGGKGLGLPLAAPSTQPKLTRSSSSAPRSFTPP